MPSLLMLSGADAVNLLTGLAWPVLIGFVIWQLLPNIRSVLQSRSFSVKAGGMEISVQDASDQVARRLEDLREQVSTLRAQTGDAPGPDGLQKLHTVLWVDDYPENNAFEVDALLRNHIDVIQAKSTSEAVGKAVGRKMDAVITDMGRTGEGENAGLDLLRTLKDHEIDAPVIVYASAAAVARTRDEARELGAVCVTSSATELLDMLSRLGLR